MYKIIAYLHILPRLILSINAPWRYVKYVDTTGGLVHVELIYRKGTMHRND